MIDTVPAEELYGRSDAHRTEVRHISLGWYLLTAYAVVAVYLADQLNGAQGSVYWGVPMAAVVHAAGAAVSHRLRLRRDEWLTPGNIALMMWILQLVVIPGLLLFTEPRPGVLQRMPSTAAINIAMCLQTLGFIAFALCFAWRSGRSGPPPRISGPIPPVPMIVVVSFLVVGALGMVLFFRTPEAALDYYTGSPQLKDSTATSFAQGLSSLMRPFLGIGGMLWLHRGIASHSAPGQLPWFRILVALTLIFFAYSSYHYNRQAFVTALIAMMAAISLKIRRIGLPILATSAALIIVGAFFLGAYRVVYNGTRGGQINVWQVGLGEYRPDPLEQLERYFGGPQFVAIPIQAEFDRRPALEWKDLFHSALSPIPIIGKPHRAANTVTAYNLEIYGNADSMDEHPPLTVDLFWAVGIPGVLLGYGILGWAMRIIDRRHRRSRSLVGVYAYAFVAVTVVFVIAGGVAVLVQTFLYFCLPLCALRVDALLPNRAGVVGEKEGLR